MRGNVEVLAYLHNSGVEITHPLNKQNLSPLDFARESGTYDTVCMLKAAAEEALVEQSKREIADFHFPGFWKVPENWSLKLDASGPGTHSSRNIKHGRLRGGDRIMESRNSSRTYTSKRGLTRRARERETRLSEATIEGEGKEGSRMFELYISETAFYSPIDTIYFFPLSFDLLHLLRRKLVTPPPTSQPSSQTLQPNPPVKPSCQIPFFYFGGTIWGKGKVTASGLFLTSSSTPISSQ